MIPHHRNSLISFNFWNGAANVWLFISTKILRHAFSFLMWTRWQSENLKSVAFTSEWQLTINFTDYRRDALEQHNTLRAIHDAPPMRLSSSLNARADQYAQQLFNRLRCRGRLQHSNTPDEGENLASGWTTATVPEARSVQDAVKSWYVK